MRRTALPSPSQGLQSVSEVCIEASGPGRNRVIVPGIAVQVVVRYGPQIHGGVDVHVLGPRQTVHRKHVGGGHRALIARLPLGTSTTTLGATAAALAGRHVALGDLWGWRAAEDFEHALATACDPADAVALLTHEFSRRAGAAPAAGHQRIVQAAARRLGGASVDAVAMALGVTARHLRRVFNEHVGMTPKRYSRLSRFQRAVDAAMACSRPRWARIAADTGYCDQSHLIADFRAIAGASPEQFRHELRSSGLHDAR